MPKHPKTRGERRHQQARAKAKASHFNVVGANTPAKTVQMLATTPKLCSCVLCGNPRTYFGETTRQEKRANHHYEES